MLRLNKTLLPRLDFFEHVQALFNFTLSDEHFGLRKHNTDLLNGSLELRNGSCDYLFSFVEFLELRVYLNQIYEDS